MGRRDSLQMAHLADDEHFSLTVGSLCDCVVLCCLQYASHNFHIFLSFNLPLPLLVSIRLCRGLRLLSFFANSYVITPTRALD